MALFSQFLGFIFLLGLLFIYILVLLSFPRFVCLIWRSWKLRELGGLRNEFLSHISDYAHTHTCARGKNQPVPVYECVSACGADRMIRRLIATVAAGEISSGSEWNTSQTKGSGGLPKTHRHTRAHISDTGRTHGKHSSQEADTPACRNTVWTAKMDPPVI